VILIAVAKINDHGVDLPVWVELRGFEPLTPSMRTKLSAVQKDGGSYRLVINGDSKFRVVRAKTPANTGACPPAARWDYVAAQGRSGSGRTLTRSGVSVAIAPARSSSVSSPGRAASSSPARAADGRASTSRTRITEGRVSPEAKRSCTKS